MAYAGRHQDAFEPPAESKAEYDAKGLLGADGTLAMDYLAIENGGSMCVEQSEPEQQIVFGGMLFWERSDGQCMLPPTNDVGNPCCMMHMWQPNAEGMYYGDCTMKCDPSSPSPYLPLLCAARFAGADRSEQPAATAGAA